MQTETLPKRFAPFVLNPQALTQMLRDGGSLPSGEVSRVEVNGTFDTFSSKLVFIAVAYTPDAPALPSKLLVKWPHPTANEAPGKLELEFYRRLAPKLPSPPVVRCLAAAGEGVEPKWIVFEDIRSSHSPALGMPSRGTARLALRALASIHSKWWEHPQLGHGVGRAPTTESVRQTVDTAAAAVPAFNHALADSVPASDRALLERIIVNSFTSCRRITEPRARTIAHGDAHGLNFLIPHGWFGSAYLIDWQAWHVDVGASDLALMMALRWNPEYRQRHEKTSLRYYYRRLDPGARARYSFDDLMTDYRQAVVRSLLFPVMVWNFGVKTDQFSREIACGLAAFRDLGCEEFLDT